MKQIICYGDSNTFGYIPGSGKRYSKDIRWTGVLSNLLGDEYKVIEEGCNNRTGFVRNPSGKLFSGSEYINECFIRHPEFDIFILSLGTNDTQKFYTITPQSIKEGLKSLVGKIKNQNEQGKLIIVAPLILNTDVLKGGFSIQFDEESIERTHWIQKVYSDFCRENGIIFFDINSYVEQSAIDGLHYSPEAHRKIADNLKDIILSCSFANTD